MLFGGANRDRTGDLYIAIAEDGFTVRRNQARIAEEARLDGFYVIRTSLETNALATDDVVGAHARAPQTDPV